MRYLEGENGEELVGGDDPKRQVELIKVGDGMNGVKQN